MHMHNRRLQHQLEQRMVQHQEQQKQTAASNRSSYGSGWSKQQQRHRHGNEQCSLALIQQRQQRQQHLLRSGRLTFLCCGCGTR
jgi:invasion protein IalB